MGGGAELRGYERLLEELGWREVLDRVSSYHQNMALITVFLASIVFDTLANADLTNDTTAAQGRVEGQVTFNAFYISGGFALINLLSIALCCLIIDNTLKMVYSSTVLRQFLRQFYLMMSLITPATIFAVVLLGVHFNALLLFNTSFHWAISFVVAPVSIMVPASLIAMRMHVGDFVKRTTYQKRSNKHLTRVACASRAPARISPRVEPSAVQHAGAPRYSEAHAHVAAR